MSCLLTSGFTLGCRDKTGGIQKVFIGVYNGTSMGMTIGASPTYSISAFTGATVSFYTFEQEIESGSFNQAGNFNTDNGTSFYEQTLSITLQGLNGTLRNQINILGQGKWRVIILDQNGLYWMMGQQNPVRVSASTPDLGKAYGDLNGCKLTFMGKEPQPAYQVDTAAALTIIV